MRFSSSLLVLLALASCGDKKPPEAPEPTEITDAADPLDKPLPFDPGVRSGTLDNGLRWFIETNDKPEDRAVLRLVVDAGSILEDPDQLGAAHYLEHMAFNGTENFEGNELVKYLESVGTSFGAHLNAHTSFDETVYKLSVPTDDSDVFDKAFLILDDWAQGLTNDPEEVDKERGVVLEEWRRSLGPGWRARKATMPLTYPDSPYPDRLPIGTEESLKTVTRDAIHRFYTDWYRPDLMAVIVVGDVDPDAVQAKIEEHFGDLTLPEEPRERVHPEVGAHEDTEVVVFTDPEITGTSLTVRSPHDWVLDGTYRSYRDTFVQQFFTGILGERLRDISRTPDAPLRGASAYRSRMTPTEGAWVLSAGPVEGHTVDSYEVLMTELKRIREHGVTESELARAKARAMRNMESYYEERETTESVTHAQELIRHFTTGESVPGIAKEWELAQEFIPSITAEEVKAFSTVFLPDGNRAIVVRMPAKDGLTPPSAEDFASVDAKVAELTVEPPVEVDVDKPLVSELPEPGSVTDTREIEGLGFTVWTLSNGAEVWLKPTDFETEQVMFRGRSVGGHDAVSDEDYVAAATATALRGASGLGEFDATSLSKRLAGRSASASSWISGSHEGVSGGSTPADLELMMQLTWLTFTQPRFDEQMFELDKRNRAESLRNRDARPATAFSDAWTRVVWNDFERFRPWTVDTLAQMDLERSEAFYRQRFADASDWRFVFVGNLEPDTLKPLVEQYLASLPAIEREEPDARVDLGNRRAQGMIDETVRSGTDPRARVRMLFHEEFESTFLVRNRLQALSSVLSTRLREVLREDKGGVYGVSVWTNTDAWPEPVHTLTIDFVCDPERVPELEQATLEVLKKARTEPFAQRYIDEHREKSRRSREEAEKTNAFWTGLADSTVEELELTGEDIMDVLTYEERLESLTAEEVQDMAKRLIDLDEYIVVRHLPEEPADEDEASDE